MQQQCQQGSPREAANRPGSRRGGHGSAAFTLVEALVVIAIIAILAAMLLPALDKGKARGKQIACINHLKQLAMCTQMYAADNNGKLVENLPTPQNSNSWVTGNLKLTGEGTNSVMLRQGRLFPYASHPGIFHCPGDPAQTRSVAHVRSYAMNSWMGSRQMESNGNRSGHRTFMRDSETAAAGPARLWVMLDEHPDTLDDGWFLVTMDDSRPFASVPANRHQRGYALNFADGHAEVYRLQNPNLRPGWASPMDSDWLKLKQVTTTR